VCDEVLTPKPVGSHEDGSKKQCKEDTIDPGSQVPPAIKNGDKECTSPNCNNSDHLESEKNAAKGDTPSQTDAERPGQTSKRPEDKAIKNGDKKCTSPNCNNGEHLESEKNAAKGDTPSQTDVECPGQTSTRPEDKREEIIPRKSTRSKQLPVNKYKDFLY
jgi:hypothetical protein